MNQKESLKESFEKEIEALRSEAIFSPEYKRRKLIQWLIRTTIAIILIAIFWKYSWMKWVLMVYIPLALLSLFSIYGGSYFLNRKIQKTR
ncbi:MAG: hypothetical protein AAF242_05635, partial [Bacteroidota bacterium]